MKFKRLLLLSIPALVLVSGHSQSTRDEINGDWAAQQVTLYNTSEADVMVRFGDIDNLGYGWPGGFDPFSGATTPAHAFPFSPDAADVDGTDRIMVVTSYVGSPPAGQDGYTNTTSRPENLPRPIVMTYDLGGASVSSAALQIFVDDFQAPVWHANYTVTINGQQASYLSSQINTLVQTGPVGKLITIAIPASHLSQVSSGTLSILFDDLTTGAGDGYAIDFIKLLVNPAGFTFTGNITGTVTAAATGNPISGAIVSASGLVETTTAGDGTYTLANVPAGFINITTSATGFQTTSTFKDVLQGETVIHNVQMDVAVIPVCDTLHYPLQGTPTLYYVEDNGGYVCGNNVFGDLAKADYFEPDETGRLLYKAIFGFAHAVKGSGQNPAIEFRVWNNQGEGGKPGTIIGSATMPLNDIYDDVVALDWTEVVFNPPVYISGPFYLGVMLPSTTGDTLALVSNLNNEINPGYAWELWSDQRWFAMSNDSAWQLNLGQAIFAAYCDEGFSAGEITEPPGLLVYPNPAGEVLFIERKSQSPGQTVVVSLFNILGQTVKSETHATNGGKLTLSLDGLDKGMYLLTVTGGGERTATKIFKD